MIQLKSVKNELPPMAREIEDDESILHNFSGPCIVRCLIPIEGAGESLAEYHRAALHESGKWYDADGDGEERENVTHWELLKVSVEA